MVYEWMLKRTGEYTSHDMQNDMLKAMAHKVLRNINSRLHNATFLTIMRDETTNASNKEQVVIIFRNVDNNDFSVKEELIGWYCIQSLESVTLVSILKKYVRTLSRLKLPLSKLRR